MKLKLTARDRAYFANKGKQGGKARASRMTDEQRAAAAKHAADVRWGRERAKVAS